MPQFFRLIHVLRVDFQGAAFGRISAKGAAKRWHDGSACVPWQSVDQVGDARIRSDGRNQTCFRLQNMRAAHTPLRQLAGTGSDSDRLGTDTPVVARKNYIRCGCPCEDFRRRRQMAGRKAAAPAGHEGVGGRGEDGSTGNAAAVRDAAVRTGRRRRPARPRGRAPSRQRRRGHRTGGGRSARGRGR